jgi:hypothetical protein
VGYRVSPTSHSVPRSEQQAEIVGNRKSGRL